MPSRSWSWRMLKTLLNTDEVILCGHVCFTSTAPPKWSTMSREKISRTTDAAIISYVRNVFDRGYHLPDTESSPFEVNLAMQMEIGFELFITCRSYGFVFCYRSRYSDQLFCRLWPSISILWWPYWRVHNVVLARPLLVRHTTSNNNLLPSMFFNIANN